MSEIRLLAGAVEAIINYGKEGEEVLIQLLRGAAEERKNIIWTMGTQREMRQFRHKLWDMHAPGTIGFSKEIGRRGVYIDAEGERQQTKS